MVAARTHEGWTVHPHVQCRLAPEARHGERLVKRQVPGEGVFSSAGRRGAAGAEQHGDALAAQCLKRPRELGAGREWGADRGQHDDRQAHPGLLGEHGERVRVGDAERPLGKPSTPP